MIKITKENDVIIMTGHAMPTVCAAISSTMYTSVNAMLKYDEDCVNYVDDEELDMVTITIKKHDRIIDLLVDNMFKSFKDIREDFESEVNINIIR